MEKNSPIEIDGKLNEQMFVIQKYTPRIG